MNVTIEIPGDPGVEINDGDTLTIVFKSPAKFCISSGNADWFNPPLPVGVPEPKDYSWTGTCIVASGTIQYSHVGSDKTCGSSPVGVPPGTIKIGTGTK